MSLQGGLLGEGRSGGQEGRGGSPYLLISLSYVSTDKGGLLRVAVALEGEHVTRVESRHSNVRDDVFA